MYFRFVGSVTGPHYSTIPKGTILFNNIEVEVPKNTWYDKSNGTFWIPETATYLFTISGMVPTGCEDSFVGVFVNGDLSQFIDHEQDDGNARNTNTIFFLNLNKGDQLYLYIGFDHCLYGDEDHQFTFVGELI